MKTYLKKSLLLFPSLLLSLFLLTGMAGLADPQQDSSASVRESSTLAVAVDTLTGGFDSPLLSFVRPPWLNSLEEGLMDSLLDQLNESMEEKSNGLLYISWRQVEGASYQLQQYDWDSGTWSVLASYENGDKLLYKSSRLQPYHTYTYRIALFCTLGGVEYTRYTELMSLVTEEYAPGSLIWPVVDLTVYTDTSCDVVMGQVSAMCSYYALGEADGMFAISYHGDTGYIDATYCMINLPDYIGELCSYDITNSYSSIFTAHDYSITGITGTEITGYENVYIDEDVYLVPLLYPTAQMLIQAAKTAQDYGYRLKIYDAFRPNVASVSLYETTEALLDSIVSSTSLSYRTVMLGSSYKLSSFLAKSRSMHNHGLAVDLTLEDLQSGEELAMQTTMHDLSYHSTLSHNNDNANLLQKIMTSAGFGTLSSEWWHFQDNDSWSSLALPTISQGVSIDEYAAW